MSRYLRLLSLACLLALGGSLRAGPVDFDYRLRLDGVAPITLASGEPGSVTIGTLYGMTGYSRSFLGVASAAIDYTIEAASPAIIEVAVLRMTLLLKDPDLGTDWFISPSVYITGESGSTNEFLDWNGSNQIWLTPDHKYTFDFEFTPSTENNGTGRVEVVVSAIEEQQPPEAPEPSTLALLGIGMGVPFAKRLRRIVSVSVTDH